MILGLFYCILTLWLFCCKSVIAKTHVLFGLCKENYIFQSNTYIFSKFHLKDGLVLCMILYQIQLLVQDDKLNIIIALTERNL